MDQARYFVAVLMVVAMPPAIAWWYLVHPFVGFWRRLGTVPSMLILWILLLASCLALWTVRDSLIGADLGTQPALIAAAVLAAIVGGSIARKRRGILTTRILIGVPEISGTNKGHLLTEGIYARTRNPRYLELTAFTFAYVAFANYLGAWIFFVLTLPAVHLVVLLEEHELRDRFGAEYDVYCRRVPRYRPTTIKPAQ